MRNQFPHSLFGNHVTDDVVDLSSLPVKTGKSSIMNPTDMQKIIFETSKQSNSVQVSTINYHLT